MWQEEATLQTDVGHWNVLYPNPFESCIENAFGSVTAAQIKPDCKPLITGNTLGEFSWRTAAGLIQSPPSLASEGSCTTSPSECPGSPYKSCPSENLVQEKSRRMNNPVPSASGHHVIDDDPDATSPPVSVNNWWTAMLLPTTTQSHTSPTSSAIPDLDALNWSSDAAEQLSHSKAIATAYSTITADCHQHMDAGSSTLLDSSLSTGSNMGGVTDSSVWSQVLLGSASSEAMQSLHNCSVEGLPDLLYSRTIRQSNEFLLSDHLKRIEDIPPWDSTLKNFTFQGDDMNLSTLEKSTPTLQYPHLVDDRLSSTCTLPDMETWSATQDHNNAVSQSGSLTPFSSGLHLGSSHFEAIRVKQEHPLSYSCSMQSATSPSSHFESIRVKQEHPLSYSCPIPTATSPFWLQGFGVDYKGDMVSSQLMECENKPLFKSLAATSNLAGSSLGEEFLGRWSSAHSSMFPTAALQQTLTSGPAGAMSKQPVQMLAYGNSVNRHTLDLSNPRPDVKHQMHVPAIDRSSSLHYGHRTFDSKQFDSKPLHEPPSNWRTLGHAEEPRDPGPDTKRNVGSINGGDSSSEACFKRPRAEQAPATLPFKQQVRKEKLGDRITALQQLVSPFGKTDTASVLLEAIGYIKFLQEQVQVLSTPYMKSASTTTNQNENQDTADEPKQDLRSRGLCLVPVSCTLHVANDNGADYWAPSLGGGYR